MQQDDIAYHSERAMKELDLGLVCGCMKAARAHLELSSMHLQRMRELQGTEPRRKPPLVMG